MITFKEILDEYEHYGEDIVKMQWDCFGNYCYIIELDDVSVFFDIINHKIYMIDCYLEEDNSLVWVNPEYKDVMVLEASKHCPDYSYSFVETPEEVLNYKGEE